MEKEMNTRTSILPSTEANRFAIYARTASEPQTGDSTSVDLQIRKCKDMAQKNGWTIVEDCIRADRVKSGSSLHECSGLQELIALAATKPRPFDHLLCVSASRLSRSPINLAAIIDNLANSGVGIHFL